MTQLHALAAQRRPQQLGGLGEQLAEVGARQAQRRPPPRLEQAPEDAVDPLELAEHLAVEPAGGVVRPLVAQQLERALDAGQRVLDLVRQAGRELAQRRQLIDVLEPARHLRLALLLAAQEFAQAAVQLGGDRVERQTVRRGPFGAAGARRGEIGAQVLGGAPYGALHGEGDGGDEPDPGEQQEREAPAQGVANLPRFGGEVEPQGRRAERRADGVAG